MPTLLLSPPFNEDSEEIWEAALKAGWHVVQVQGWQVPKGLAGADLAYYGFLRPPFARMLARSLSRALLEPSVEWLPSLPFQYRKREVRLTTLADARPLNEPAFIKPAEDKRFPAQVYSSGALLPQNDSLSESLPVLLSEPVSWEVEYRCFVWEREIATVSPYWRAGRFSHDNEGNSWPAPSNERDSLLEWGRAMVIDPAVTHPPAVVIDIGWIEEKGSAVVEADPARACGLYGFDPIHLLPVVQRACVPLASVTEAERCWVGEASIEVIMGHTS